MHLSVAYFAQRTYRSIRKRLVPGRGLMAARHKMPDVADADFEIMQQVEPYTMIGADRLLALIEAVRYVERARLPGAVVECGVWRGGATMAAMITMLKLGRDDRDFYLYDTFEGMSTPTIHDRRIDGRHAMPEFHARRTGHDSADWCRASLDDVRAAVLSTGYPAERIHFVKGKVEETIPRTIPPGIALLRLDTDWYESTRHEMEHLFPRLSQHGVLILDDYGHWQGARQAVDEYMDKHRVALLLSRTDYTGRMGVKI
jgi:hypothetical protein